MISLLWEADGSEVPNFDQFDSLKLCFDILLFTVCRVCLIQYFERNRKCPKCEVDVHQSNPLNDVLYVELFKCYFSTFLQHLFRVDNVLQELVYKLIPGLLNSKKLVMIHTGFNYSSVQTNVLERKSFVSKIQSHSMKKRRTKVNTRWLFFDNYWGCRGCQKPWEFHLLTVCYFFRPRSQRRRPGSRVS